MENSVGKCCFCKGECNPASQACGKCMRTYPPVYLDELICEQIEVSSPQDSPDLKILKSKFKSTSKTPCNTPVVSNNKIDNFPSIDNKSTDLPLDKDEQSNIVKQTK